MNIQSFDANQAFSLNTVQVDPARNIISVDGQDTRVEPRLMAVLVRLATADGGVVSRETLIDDVWGRDDPNDEALTQTISRLRRAVGDDPKQPRIIETVPKRGYRLMITPEPVETHKIGSEAAETEASQMNTRGAGWMKFPPALSQIHFLWAAVILIGGVVLYSTLNKPQKEIREIEVYLKP